MRNKAVMNRQVRLAVLHLALAALFFRALVPAGWMPNTHAGLIICSLQTSAVQHLGSVHHDGPADHGSGKTQHQECTFAHAPNAVVPSFGVVLANPAIHAFVAVRDSAHAAVIATRFSPGAPRAPPAAA